MMLHDVIGIALCATGPGKSQRPRPHVDSKFHCILDLSSRVLEPPQAHLKAFLAATHLEALLHGNLSTDAACAVLGQARSALGGKALPAEKRPSDQAVQLPIGATLYR